MIQHTPEELEQILSQPFSDADIEWRISATTKSKDKGRAVPYVTNRAIQSRLDQAVGIDGWYNAFTPWQADSGSKKAAQLCTIFIYFPTLETWLGKSDGADNSDIEPVKGGLSDSMKRAAVQWGIGRYLYGMPQVWVAIDDRGAIVREERSKLDQTHSSWVKSLGAKAQRAGSGPAPNAPSPGKPQPAPQPPAPPPAKAPAPPAPAPEPAPAPAPAQAEPVYYMVTGIVLKPSTASGDNTSVQLRDTDGKTTQAFMQGTDPALAAGIWLYDVDLSRKVKNGVTFYTLNSYKLYAETAA